MDHAGPMTRSALDAALVLRALAGYDPADSTTSVLPVPDYAAALTGDVKGLRVGVLRASFLESAAPEVRAAVEHAVTVLEGLGARVDEVTLEHVGDVAAAVEAAATQLGALGASVDEARIDHLGEVAAGTMAIVAAEALAYHAEWVRTRPGDYQPDVIERLRAGAFVSGVHYVRAQQARALVRAGVDAALARRDVLLSPATPIPATRVGETEVTLGEGPIDVRGSLLRFTRPFNFSGHPACALPCGFTSDGLPIGLQLVGRPFDEATVLRVADAYQRATDWHTRLPQIGGQR
jgi:Asp-tRNA(Asn)/Glu-tRNA(Gln) amidotransferase A subunit family amidase